MGFLQLQVARVEEFNVATYKHTYYLLDARGGRGLGPAGDKVVQISSNVYNTSIYMWPKM